MNAIPQSSRGSRLEPRNTPGFRPTNGTQHLQELLNKAHFAVDDLVLRMNEDRDELDRERTRFQSEMRSIVNGIENVARSQRDLQRNMSRILIQDETEDQALYAWISERIRETQKSKIERRKDLWQSVSSIQTQIAMIAGMLQNITDGTGANETVVCVFKLVLREYYDMSVP